MSSHTTNPSHAIPLSEAVKLGNTLIGETNLYYYETTNRCGCFTASAAAALGALNDDGVMLNSKGWKWLTLEFPWTGESVKGYPELYALHQKAIASLRQRHDMGPEWNPDWSGDYEAPVAHALSHIHESGIMNRMEMAEVVARIEPKPSPAPSSKVGTHELAEA